MNNLTGFKIIVIDCSEAYQLRAALMAAGAVVHTVTPDGALLLARSRHIDAAFIGFGSCADARSLCEQLYNLGVGQIILAPDGAEQCDQQTAVLADLVFGVSRVWTDRSDLRRH